MLSISPHLSFCMKTELGYTYDSVDKNMLGISGERAVRERLIAQALLMYPDLSMPMILYTDTIDHFIGAAMSR